MRVTETCVYLYRPTLNRVGYDDEAYVHIALDDETGRLWVAFDDDDGHYKLSKPTSKNAGASFSSGIFKEHYGETPFDIKVTGEFDAHNGLIFFETKKMVDDDINKEASDPVQGELIPNGSG